MSTAPVERVALWLSVLLVSACGDSGSGGGGDGAGAGSNSGGETAGGSGGGGGGSANGDGRYVISPPYTPAPETIVDETVPQGALELFTMSSTDSAIYLADVATGEPFTREVSVYIPAQYQAGTPAPFMVVQDGRSFYEGTMVPVLDNLIAAEELPIMIAIFVEPGPNGGPTEGQRSFEYDSMTDDYLRFVEEELLPRVEADYGVELTTDPEGRAAMGGSSGGAAAFTMGWLHPELYRRILTYSGSFCALQASAEYPNGAWTYHESLIAGSPAKPLRVALQAGENDLVLNTDENLMRHWLEANEAMADVLEAQGYHYRYVYAEGAEHIDFAVLQQTLPDTLRWLWQGYPI